MQKITIDGQQYEVADAVAARIQEYYDSAIKANRAANELASRVRTMRELQKDYFKTRQHLTLTRSKVAEAQVDDYLDGKKKAAEAQQQELFR